MISLLNELNGLGFNVALHEPDREEDEDGSWLYGMCGMQFSIEIRCNPNRQNSYAMERMSRAGNRGKGGNDGKYGSSGGLPAGIERPAEW
jgi:hypothetical protein